jgi:hypothetical protein
MFKMGSHDPFGHLKHKLWSPKRLRVKLTIWFPSTKSKESPQFPQVQVACNISLESSWQGLQLCFKTHLNQNFADKVMGPQSYESPNFGNFGKDSHLGVPKQNAIWMCASWRGTKYTISGKVLASPKFRSWWILWIRVYLWFVQTPKVLKLCSN